MKSVNRKEEIINQAARLFQKRGYSAVTMRDIAEVMDIKAASLYNHITGKQEILSVLVLTVANEFTRGITSVTQKPLTTREKLQEIIKMHIDIAVHYADGIAVMNNDWMHLENKELTQFIAMRDGYEELFRQVIKGGIAEGTITDKNPEVILFSILSTLRTLHLWNQKRGGLTLQELKASMTTVLLQGIY